MNSNFNKFDFDLGIGSNNRSSKSLNDQKNKSNNNNNNNNSYSSYSYSSSTTSFSQPKTTPSWQPGKPSWTHQPAPSQPGVTRTELGGPACMVGDITGRSWNSTAPPPKVAVASSIGIVNKNPNLFGDLVSSAIGQNNKIGSNNVPLKSATPVKNSNSFSMGGVADTLPKTSSGSGGGYGSGGGGVGVASWATSNHSSVSGGTSNASVNKGLGSGLGLGGSSLRSSGGVGGGMSSNKDPFGSLMGFSSKPMGSSVGGAGGTGIGSAGKAAATMQSDDFGFGDFQKASKSNMSGGGSVPNMSSFGTQKQTAPVHTTSDDAFDMFVSSKPASGMGNATTDSGAGGQQFSGGDDWLDSGFGGHDDGNTTELDGLPPPPAGVSASTAKTKGLDNYKQGQYADAIKWLSWAEVLLERAGEVAGTMEVLSCRASCYKEVGEYKKAVADCTKVLDNDGKNVAALVQRALLYESMEKYRLGAEDLRTVMKLDPMNRVARSTIHRLQKMAD